MGILFYINPYLISKPTVTNTDSVMEAMDNEYQIAREEAEILHRNRYWNLYSTFDGTYDPRTVSGKAELEEEQERLMLERRKKVVAWRRAKASKRKYAKVLMEVEFGVLRELAKILEKDKTHLDPVLKGLKNIVVKKEGEVCSICLQKMENNDEDCMAMECKHRFHGSCIWKWLQRKNTCPLCRFKLLI